MVYAHALVYACVYPFPLSAKSFRIEIISRKPMQISENIYSELDMQKALDAQKQFYVQKINVLKTELDKRADECEKLREKKKAPMRKLIAVSVVEQA